MCAQVVLGIVAHWIKVPIRALQTSSGRGPVHYLHVGLGLVTVVIGWVTVWYGESGVVHDRESPRIELIYDPAGMSDDWWPGNTGYAPVGTGWKAGWAVVVGIVLAAYIAGIVFLLPKQRALEREQKERKHDELSESRQVDSGPVSRTV